MAAAVIAAVIIAAPATSDGANVWAHMDLRLEASRTLPFYFTWPTAAAAIISTFSTFQDFNRSEGVRSRNRAKNIWAEFGILRIPGVATKAKFRAFRFR
jgi:hypothetical protein